MTKSFWISSILLLVGILFPPNLYAHRIPLVMTTIEKMDDGKIGITHRFHAHDAISILAKAKDVKSPNLEDVKNRAKFALYTRDNFLMASKEAKTGEISPTVLKIIGAEVEGEYIFIYQELDSASLPPNAYLRSTLLSEMGNDWLSHVNVNTNGEIESLTFSGKSRWRSLGN